MVIRLVLLLFDKLLLTGCCVIVFGGGEFVVSNGIYFWV